MATQDANPTFLGSYTLESFEPFIKGEQHLPNTTVIEHEDCLKNIASFGHSYAYKWGYARLARNNRKVWTAFFLNVRDGTGMAVSYVFSAAVCVRFAICQHEKVARPTDRPNPSRGWHPGVCSKCGLNMDVDSGD